MSTTRWTLRAILKTSNAKVAPQGVTTSDSTFTALLTDVFILCDATSNAITVTLPTPVNADGKIYYIKRTSSNSNLVTVTTAAKTIDGKTKITLSEFGQMLVVISNGTDWYLISQPEYVYNNDELQVLNDNPVTL